jgi:hypothetical protein
LYTPRVGVAATCADGSIKWSGKGLVYNKNGAMTEEEISPTPTLRIQLQYFAQMIRGEKTDALPLEDSVLNARILDAMYRKAGLDLRGTA